MLVVSRKKNESVIVPAINLEVMLIETRDGKVRLGFECPKEVTVLRQELVAPEQVFGELLDAKKKCHGLRNTLSTVSTGLALLQRQIQAGSKPEDVSSTIARIRNSVNASTVTATTTTKKIHTLLVEDDENQRELLAGILRLSGIAVHAVEDGDDALEYLLSHEAPDVILCDMNMPRMNGCELARAVRDKGIRSKIFMVTGADSPAKVPPVDRWLHKPVSPEKLVRELNAIQIA